MEKLNFEDLKKVAGGSKTNSYYAYVSFGSGGAVGGPYATSALALLYVANWAQERFDEGYKIVYYQVFYYDSNGNEVDITEFTTLTN